ncbi:MAG: penicillin-binding protein [Flavobacteriaceae bacterium]|nr:penicillin-binding protein [Flavobacteriaceae bacterium]|tara:strand:- start:11222 stop:13204 length:1983 start_codon:yes stop_codon:yes gene_type:complete
MNDFNKNINIRTYFIGVSILVFAIILIGKLFYIQTYEGQKFKDIANKRTLKNVAVKPIRGNIYSDDQSLLATSVSRYDLHWDSKVVSDENFQKNKQKIAEGISEVTKRNFIKVLNSLENAKDKSSRYWLVAKNLTYSDQQKIKALPIFNLPSYQGGLRIQQQLKREKPLGKIAERTIGYERLDSDGTFFRVGLEGAFGTLLKGKEGIRLKRKIANGQWKSVNNTNEKEPTEGFDLYTTININFQDIAHNALLNQLEKFEADHGSVIIMEVKTGSIKAIVNLGVTSKGKYFEKLNYAVGESHEPGSTFKLMSMVAALEDKVIKPSDLIDTGNGEILFFGKHKVRDSRKGGYGKISVSKVFEVSSNTGMVKIINDNYKNNPENFVDRLYNMRLHKILDIPIIGEARPKIPYPSDPDWDGLDLPWMAFGYGVSITPLQTLTFYNAIANNGVMIKPKFIHKIGRLGAKPHKTYKSEILNPSICSKETLNAVQEMMFNVVEKKWGTANNIKDEMFSIAGKTGTCQIDYTTNSIEYISSFVGYFPADKPKYSCIVLIHKPNKLKGYYGSIVAAPVFKQIAKKIYSAIPKEIPVNLKDLKSNSTNSLLTIKNKLPNLVGLEPMDVIVELEKIGISVKIYGKSGKISNQSVPPGTLLSKIESIILELS